jgi:transcriptional regulator with XRE-family HTH domain
MPSSLGDKIRKHRREKGYSLEKLAKLTDSSKSYLWELENLSTPEEKCIDFPEQKYISEAGKKGR